MRIPMGMDSGIPWKPPRVVTLNGPCFNPFNHGLVAWYPFDGNASDMSGNGNHGTMGQLYLLIDIQGLQF